MFVRCLSRAFFPLLADLVQGQFFIYIVGTTLCVCVHVHVFTCICVYCMCVCACVCVCVHACVCQHACACACECTFTCVHCRSVKNAWLHKRCDFWRSCFGWSVYRTWPGHRSSFTAKHLRLWMEEEESAATEAEDRSFYCQLGHQHMPQDTSDPSCKTLERKERICFCRKMLKIWVLRVHCFSILNWSDWRHLCQVGKATLRGFNRSCVRFLMKSCSLNSDLCMVW